MGGNRFEAAGGTAIEVVERGSAGGDPFKVVVGLVILVVDRFFIDEAVGNLVFLTASSKPSLPAAQPIVDIPSPILTEANSASSVEAID